MAGVRSRALFYGAILTLALVASAPSGCSAAGAVLEAAAAAPPTAENVTANAPAAAPVVTPTNGSRNSAYANAGGFRTGIYINCGGRNVSNVGNITWQADAYFFGGETFSNTLAVVGNTTAAYDSPLLYQSLRYFGGEDLPINAYSIPVNESGYYWVRLHFAEILYKEASLRVFNVSIEGSPSLISFHLNASNMVVVKEFFVPVSDTVLDIQFVRGPVGDPMISAIEVTMAPTGMYDLEVTSDTVLATEFRLDCGGNQPFLDQGGRMWLPDTGPNAPANVNNTYIWTSYFNSENLVPGTDVTPDLLPLHIYQSQRVVANIERLGLHALAPNQSVELRKQYRDPLVYTFVVDPLAKYFIRLHQVESNLPWAGARLMNITINQQLAVANLDVYKEVGLDSPYIVDLLVSATPTGLLVLNITAAVTAYTNDPMIAGIELFKVLTTGPLLRNYTPKSGANGIWKSLAITLMCLLGLGVLVATGLLLLPLALKQRVSADPNNFKGTQSHSQFFNGLLGGASTAGNSRDHSSMQHSGAGGSTSGIQSRGSGHLSAHGTQIFPLEELKEATNHFSRDNILGQGGFGQVFKATLWSGQIAAVKRLDLFSQQGEREFLTEVELLSRLHHKNLVSLIGYCDETSQLMLVYEYIPCGTLRDHLRLPEKAAQLDWPARLKISVGAARGLEYLHRGASPSVIHRDIKTSNIILDVDHEAKVTDFGLSKLGRNAALQTHISTNVKGTLGYLDPNYYAKQHLTEKSDVYSFGVVMLELLTGRMPIWQHDDDSYDDEKLCNLVEWATDHLKRDDVTSILAPQLAEAVQYDESIRQFAQLAWNMTEHQSKLRPNMGEVLRRLEKAAQLADSAALLPPTAAVSTAATGMALTTAVVPLDSSLQSILSLDALSLPAVPEQPEAQDETATINTMAVAAKVSPSKDASPDRRALAPPAKVAALPAKHIAAAPFATPLPSVTNWTPVAALKPPRILLPAGAFPSGAI